MLIDLRYDRVDKINAHPIRFRMLLDRAGALGKRNASFEGVENYVKKGMWFGDPRRSFCGWDRWLLGERSEYQPRFTHQHARRKPKKYWGVPGRKGSVVGVIRLDDVEIITIDHKSGEDFEIYHY